MAASTQISSNPVHSRDDPELDNDQEQPECLRGGAQSIIIQNATSFRNTGCRPGFLCKLNKYIVRVHAYK